MKKIRTGLELMEYKQERKRTIIMRSCFKKKTVLLIGISLVLIACSSCQRQENATQDATVEDDINLSEKYSGIIEKLEKEDYDGAIEEINAMRPEPETETIKITLDNWEDYYTFEKVYNYQYDAKGDISTIDMGIYFCLKPEYLEKVISLSGSVGYEYRAAVHKITNLNKDEGSIGAEVLEGVESHMSPVSTTQDLLPSMIMADGEFWHTAGGLEEYSVYLDVQKYEAHEWMVDYPDIIDIVQIDGELILNSFLEK